MTFKANIITKVVSLICKLITNYSTYWCDRCVPLMHASNAFTSRRREFKFAWCDEWHLKHYGENNRCDWKVDSFVSNINDMWWSKDEEEAEGKRKMLNWIRGTWRAWWDVKVKFDFNCLENCNYLISIVGSCVWFFCCTSWPVFQNCLSFRILGAPYNSLHFCREWWYSIDGVLLDSSG